MLKMLVMSTKLLMYKQATSSSAWLPVLRARVPEPRPGTCVNNTEALPDNVLNFIRYVHSA